MRTLLLHDTTPDDAVAAVLEAAGHQIVRCSEPGRPGFPCSRVAGGGCPLDGSVDVAVDVHQRPTAEIAPDEVGVVCAMRDGVPVVVFGNRARSPFDGRWDAVATSIDDLPAACQRAVADTAARASAYVKAFAGVPARVVRHGHEVRVHLERDATAAQAVLARQAATRFFPSARSVDVDTAF